MVGKSISSAVPKIKYDGRKPPGANIVQIAGPNRVFQKVLTDLLAATSTIDPGYDFEMGSIAILVDIADLGIYGDKVWRLFSHLCGKSLVTTVAVVKAWKLGLVTKEKIHEGMMTKGEGWNMGALLTQVYAKSPDFNQAEILKAATEKAETGFVNKGTGASRDIVRKRGGVQDEPTDLEVKE